MGLSKEEFALKAQRMWENGISFELPQVVEPGGQHLLFTAVVDALNSLIKNSPNLEIEYSWMNQTASSRVWAITPHAIGYYAIGQAVEKACSDFGKRYSQAAQDAYNLAESFLEVAEKYAYSHIGLAWEFTDEDFLSRVKEEFIPKAQAAIEKYKIKS